MTRSPSLKQWSSAVQSSPVPFTSDWPSSRVKLSCWRLLKCSFLSSSPLQGRSEVKHTDTICSGISELDGLHSQQLTGKNLMEKGGERWLSTLCSTFTVPKWFILLLLLPGREMITQGDVNISLFKYFPCIPCSMGFSICRYFSWAQKCHTSHSHCKGAHYTS